MTVQRRNAALTYQYIILLLIGVLLSTVSRRLEPLCVVLPLVVALLYSRLTLAAPVFTLTCQVTPPRAFEGDPITVTITMSATTVVPPLEIWHLIPPEATCVSGSPRVLCTLQAGATYTTHHAVTFARRGIYTLGRLYGRVHLPTDLQPLLLQAHHDFVCRVYPRVTPLPQHLPPLHTHVSFGHYVSRHVGEGLEFAGVRQYNSGDRLRRVHWRTSLVRQQLYVNDYYCERNADVVLLLDTLASVGTAHLNTLDVAVRAAASLAAHYLYHKDRVGLINYGGICTWVTPAVGQLQLSRLLDALLESRTHFSYLSKDVGLIPPRVLPPGALLIVLTPLLDPRLLTALHDLLARAFQVVLVVLSPLYVLPTVCQPHQAEATAVLWRLEMERHLAPFRHLGVPVILQESEDPLQGLYALLTRRQRLPLAPQRGG